MKRGQTGVEGVRLGRGRRAPGQQPVFELADQPLRAEHDHRDDEHRGEHAVGVEVVLRGLDDQTEPALRTEHLADERADDGEAEGTVQAGDDPRQCRGQDDVPGGLHPGGAEHLDVGENVAVDLADALVSVEEDDEEHQYSGQQDLRGDTDTEGDDEDRAENDARDRVDHLDVGTEHVGEVAALPERDTEHDPGERTHGEAGERLLDGRPDVLVEGAELGAVLEEIDQPLPDARRLTEEERVDNAPAGERLPAADHEGRETDTARPHPGDTTPRGPLRVTHDRTLAAIGRGHRRNGGRRTHSLPPAVSA